MNLEKANKIDFNNYLVKNDYPDITANNLPDDILYKLKKIYAGNKGEFTSVNQYMYQHFILYYNNEINNIAHTLEKISIKEMQHFEIIAKILVKSNVDPKICTFIDNNPKICNSWNSNEISYVKDIENIMKVNIKLENISIKEYNDILKSTTNDNLKDIIKRILEDEYSHLNYFNDILKYL